MLKKIADAFLQMIKEEYKFIIFLLFFLIILNYPVNYYINTGGGISDVSSRVIVEDGYSSKGSFNISYVSQLNGTLLFYWLSYLIPTWERESIDDYKYTETENVKDIAFRGELDLKVANSTATYWAYTLAKKDLELKSSELYVIIIDSVNYPTKLQVGDIIESVDGNHFDEVSDYIKYIQIQDVGKELEIEVKRNGKTEIIKTPVYEKDGVKLIGVVLKYYREYEAKPNVEFKFRKIEMGPSGGLITTLELYNQLTKKDLTKGKTIAGTGTIEADGTIGQIGGIEHKVLGAASAKADIFLLPAGDNYKDAKKYVEEKKLKIKLVSVESIEDAIKKLEKLK